MLMEQCTHSWEEAAESNWSSWTNTLEQTEGYLRREYGEPQLIAYQGDGDQRGHVDLKTFVQRCYPRQFLDTVEAHYSRLDPQEEPEFFQREVNRIFHEEGQPWRMSGGEIFMVDSEFLDVEVIARTEELLSANGYAGALDEFRDARNELTAGETREAIAKAQAAYESTMKTILGVHDGTASSLIRSLVESGFFGDLPTNTQAAAFGESVLMSLAFMGNRLGRHGQGEDVVEVPRHYAELAVHLAGSLIRMLVERQLELQGTGRAPEPVASITTGDIEFGAADDDIPF